MCIRDRYEREYFILYNTNRQNNFYCKCEAIGKCEEAFGVSQDAMEIVNTLTQIINRLGIRLLTGHRVELISNDKENGKYSLRFGGNRSSATADCVVVAIGGTPVASQLST